jgi:hypothetical protein
MTVILQRLYKQSQAPSYLGMSEPTFNQLVRPFLTEIKGEGRSIWYDRLDLDRWADDYKAANGRPCVEKSQWRNQPPVSDAETASGTFKKPSMEYDFAKAQDAIGLKTPRGICKKRSKESGMF